MKLERNIQMMFVVVITILLGGCISISDSGLPKRQQPKVIDVSQQLYKNNPFKNEYTFCSQESGDWICPSITPKTEIKKTSVVLSVNNNDIQTKSNVERSRRISFSDKNEIKRNSEYGDIIGDPVEQIHFDFASYRLKDDFKNILNNLVPKLEGKPLLIFGFTHQLPSSLKKPNDQLAIQRAESVKDYLIKKGIPSENIHTEGVGVCCFIAPNDTKENRALNRRVEIYFAI